MTYRRDLWEIAAHQHGIVTVRDAEEAGIPAVELRKLAQREALDAFGNGVYMHADVPLTRFSQPALAVTLAGERAMLHCEAVLDLVGVGQFNPPKIRVATTRRVRRTLPEWLALERRTDISDENVTSYEGILATTVAQALADVRGRPSLLRWESMVDQAMGLGLVGEQDCEALRLQTKEYSS